MCPRAKHTRKPFPTSTSISENCFDLLHVDIWGPTGSKLKYRVYFLTVGDDSSRHTWTFLMQNKTGDVVDILEFLVNMIHTQVLKIVRCIRIDSAKELCEGKIATVFHKHRIMHQRSCIDSPQ